MIGGVILGVVLFAVWLLQSAWEAAGLWLLLVPAAAVVGAMFLPRHRGRAPRCAHCGNRSRSAYRVCSVCGRVRQQAAS